jgi:hypothetical protein
MAGRYDNPMPTRFLAPVAGLKFQTRISSEKLSNIVTEREEYPKYRLLSLFHKKLITV